MKNLIESLVSQALDALEVPADARGAVAVERARGKGHGDFATNAALVLARTLKQSPRVIAERLVDALDEHMDEVDTALQETIPNWRLERLAVIDRNVLRIAAVELLEFDDVPGKVAIHEAIQLAEKYGSEDSPGFVNGVLDGLYKKLQDRENAHAG